MNIFGVSVLQSRLLCVPWWGQFTSCPPLLSELNRKCGKTKVVCFPPSFWVQSQQIKLYGTCLIFKDINGATCKLRHQTSVKGILFIRRYSYDVVNEYVNIVEGKVYILYESLSGRITCMLCCTFLCRHAVMNRDGSDGMVTVCRIGDRVFDSKKGGVLFAITAGLTWLHTQCVPGSLSSGVREFKRECGHWPLSGTQNMVRGLVKWQKPE